MANSLQVDPEVAKYDSMLDRWACYARASEVSGYGPNVIGAEMARRASVPLRGLDEFMPDDLVTLDRIIAQAPRMTAAVIKIWYLSDAFSAVKAKRLGISRAALYSHWRAALWYIRGVWDAQHLTTAPSRLHTRHNAGTATPTATEKSATAREAFGLPAPLPAEA